MEMTKLGAWCDVKNAARTTINKDPSAKEPTDQWKKQILLAEHSPIRTLHYRWTWQLKSWISVHFVRHKYGIEHFVSTQREDRTGIDRNSKRQDASVRHECEANAQAIMNISRRRLCYGQPHKETRLAWEQVIQGLKTLDPILAEVCVPECIYRGFCPEFQSCGFVNTKEYQERVHQYRQTTKKQVKRQSQRRIFGQIFRWLLWKNL